MPRCLKRRPTKPPPPLPTGNYQVIGVLDDVTPGSPSPRIVTAPSSLRITPGAELDDPCLPSPVPEQAKSGLRRERHVSAVLARGDNVAGWL
jgi:hypothetical protein